MNLPMYEVMLGAAFIGAVVGFYGFETISSQLPGNRIMYQHGDVFNVLQCARLCADAWPCDTIQYCPQDAGCVLYADCPECTSNSVNCSDGGAPLTVGLIGELMDLPEPLTCISHKHLVTGPDGVEDGQLTASSFFCDDPTRPGCDIDPLGLSPKYARLNSTHPQGSSWSVAPDLLAAGQYIQVDFESVKLATGVVLAGRAVFSAEQYVTAFTLSFSLDCATFVPFTDDSNNATIFAGCSFVEEVVTTCFPQPVQTRCVRLYPTAWNNYMSLRFDVRGV